MWNEYRGKNVIIATGAHARPIGCKGEGQFRGKGVSYCATCDANFFEDFEVYVVGGGDSAVEEAMYLTKFARKVTIIHRRDELRAAKSIQEKYKNNRQKAQEEIYKLYDNNQPVLQKRMSFTNYMFKKNISVPAYQLNNLDKRYLHWLLLGPLAPYQFKNHTTQKAA